MNHVYVLLVEGGHPDVVLVRKADFKVAGTAAAVPHVVVVLPVFAEGGGEIVLRKRNPLLRGEKRPLAFAYVLRHEEVAAVDDVVPVLLARGTPVAVPEEMVRLLSV